MTLTDVGHLVRRRSARGTYGSRRSRRADLVHRRTTCRAVIAFLGPPGAPPDRILLSPFASTGSTQQLTDPSTWIEVRLSDFDAPELQSPTGRTDRDRLSGLVRGRVLNCVAVRGRNGRVIVYDRVIASCRMNGRRVGELLRAAGGREGGK